jgi:Ca-activated chloride channel family protein
LLTGTQITLAGQFSSGISLVEVYATVTDASGNPVRGLTSDDFAVQEDGAPQSISAFASGEFPLSVAIGLDRSFSMSRERVRTAAAAAGQFVSALRPDDQVMVLAIGSEVETVAPLSSLSAGRAAAMSALETLEPWGTTPLYDATLAALDAIQTATGRRALVLISDGMDRYSDATAAQVVDRARRKDVLIYPIATGRARPPLFAELAGATGGRSFQARDARALETALATIARELREQYLIGYAPARAPEESAQWRSITVTVNKPNVRVRARDGYYSR